ncbi:MAG: hypothetical protein HQ518_24085 [Rhodopirellula sp.]|nr:hypothetical protein [Rhodopirellula sp.]
MKRLLAVGTIVAYLGVLALGLGSHALHYRTGAHPSMYFIVWDMFCGWSAYEDRTHIIGQGESGKYYNLAPAPWGDYRPFGDIERHHYDPFTMHSGALALSTLRHTEHEPIQQIFVVQETWAKKFNLPDQLWAERYTEPKDPHSYFHLLKILDGNGELQVSNLAWFDYQAKLCLSDNPRLTADANRNRPFLEMQSQVQVSDTGSRPMSLSH